MSDWLYEATYAQARLENTMTTLASVEKQLQDCTNILRLIATDQIELSHDKMHWQLAHYRMLARDVLGYKEPTRSTGESNVEIDNDF